MTEKKKPAKKQARAKSAKDSKSKENKLKDQLKQANKELETLNDRLLRSVADLDNFRKRKEREIAQIIETANEKLIKDLLPVVDDFERSLKMTNAQDDPKALQGGMEMISQKLQAMLRKYGVEPMGSIGKPFDVDCHDALLQVDAKDTPPDIVIEEHEKGYLRNGKVLRHARVVVSK